MIVTLCSLLSCINTSSNHSSVDLDVDHASLLTWDVKKHRQGPGLGVARWRRADPSCTCTQRKRSDRHTHAWHDDGETWLVGVAERLCSLPTNMAIYNRKRGRSCIASGEAIDMCSARHRKKALFLPRPAGRQSLRIQSHRTRVIGEGVSAHVNVMDSWPLALSVPLLVVGVSESEGVPFTSSWARIRGLDELPSKAAAALP